MQTQEKQTQQQQPGRQPYERPQIIHESEISTRAGSPTGNPTGTQGVDPADLFGK
ncbi:MAG: hypothetical protein Kow0080_28030 [Candidatus Promineifilaceae bacterium]